MNAADPVTLHARQSSYLSSARARFASWGWMLQALFSVDGAIGALSFFYAFSFNPLLSALVIFVVAFFGGNWVVFGVTPSVVREQFLFWKGLAFQGSHYMLLYKVAPGPYSTGKLPKV